MYPVSIKELMSDITVPFVLIIKAQEDALFSPDKSRMKSSLLWSVKKRPKHVPELLNTTQPFLVLWQQLRCMKLILSGMRNIGVAMQSTLICSLPSEE